MTPGGHARLSKDRGAAEASDSGGSDRAGSAQPHDRQAEESGSSDAETSSDESGSQDGELETCQTVKLIMLKSEVTAAGGLAVLCLHHEFTGSPFMEVEAESLTLRHHMMLDHDVLEAELLSPVLNDLTMWPRTEDPRAFKAAAEARQRKVLQLDTWARALGFAGGHAGAGHHAGSLADLLQELPRQEVLGARDSDNKAGVRVRTTVHYDGCPLQAEDWSVQSKVTVSNIRIRYYHEPLMRMLTYFTARFLWALTESDPYEEFTQAAAKKPMLEHEINHIKDLCQPDLALDLLIEVQKTCVQVTERPYLTERSLELEIDNIKITQAEEVVTGRHASLRQLQMKLTRMIFEVEGVSLIYSDQRATPPRKEAISNSFNIDGSLLQPSYSEVLELISSGLLDKSSEVVLRFHPSVALTLSQDVYTFVMRCNSLNFAYCDRFGAEFDFSHVNEIFQSKEKLLYMRTKIQVDRDFEVTLFQEGSELVQMKLRNLERSRSSRSRDAAGIAGPREMIKVDQFLDGQMRIQVQMGIPTLLHPPGSEPGAKAGQVTVTPPTTVRHLLLGTESDLHVVEAPDPGLGSGADIVELETEDLAQSMAEDQKKPSEQSHRKPGKLLVEVTWAADGQQHVDCRVDRVKLFVRPDYFLRLGHFFVEGLPEFDPASEDRPNDYEADFEKLPVLKMKLDIVESMLCVESYDPADLVAYLENQAFYEPASSFKMDSFHGPMAGAFQGTQVSSVHLGSQFTDSRRATLSRRQTAKQGALAASVWGSAPAEDPLKQGQDGQAGKGLSSFSTIVCKAHRIEYVYAREQISSIKEALYTKLKEFSRQRRREQAQAEQAMEPDEETLGEDQIDSSSKKVAPEVSSLAFAEQEAEEPGSEVLEEPIPEAQPEVGESAFESKQSYMRVLLKIRQFSPYICDSLDLESFGFDDIQKRQLISPADITFGHRKLLKVEFKDNRGPARFTAVEKGEVEVGKSLVKLTFSDVFVLQDASTRLLESQQRYHDFLVQYLVQRRREEVALGQEQRRFSVDKSVDRSGSFLSFSRAGRGRSRGQSFKSFLPFPSGESSTRPIPPELDDEEAELIQNAALHATSQLRSSLVAYMTGFSSQVAAPLPYTSHGSVSGRSRRNSSHDFYDAKSRSSVSGQSPRGKSGRAGSRAQRAARQGAGTRRGPALRSATLVEALAPSRTSAQAEALTGSSLVGMERRRSGAATGARALGLVGPGGTISHRPGNRVAVIQEEAQINETDLEGEDDLVLTAPPGRPHPGEHVSEPAVIPGQAAEHGPPIDVVPVDVMSNLDSEAQFFSIRGTSMAEWRAPGEPPAQGEQLSEVEGRRGAGGGPEPGSSTEAGWLTGGLPSSRS